MVGIVGLIRLFLFFFRHVVIKHEQRLRRKRSVVVIGSFQHVPEFDPRTACGRHWRWSLLLLKKYLVRRRYIISTITCIIQVLIGWLLLRLLEDSSIVIVIILGQQDGWRNVAFDWILLILLTACIIDRIRCHRLAAELRQRAVSHADRRFIGIVVSIICIVVVR